MILASMNHHPEDQGETAVLTVAERWVKKPALYKVTLYNDDYTPMDFVVWILMTIFHKQEGEAVEIMLQVHREGMDIAGIYPSEIAEMKVDKVRSLARQHEYPLRCSMERE